MKIPGFSYTTLSCLLFLIAFVSCSGRKNSGQEYQVSGDSLSQDRIAGKPVSSLNTGFRVIGDSVQIPGFIIEINLSPAAEKELKDQHESVIVQAYFSGEPKDTTSEEYQEEGVLNIGSYRIELFDTRTAIFNHIKIKKALFGELENKNFEVLINVFSGRHSSELNILNCDILQENIRSVAGKKFTLNGRLIRQN